MIPTLEPKVKEDDLSFQNSGEPNRDTYIHDLLWATWSTRVRLGSRAGGRHMSYGQSFWQAQKTWDGGRGHNIIPAKALNNIANHCQIRTFLRTLVGAIT